jgi:hypothetical protein
LTRATVVAAPMSTMAASAAAMVKVKRGSAVPPGAL